MLRREVLARTKLVSPSLSQPRLLESGSTSHKMLLFALLSVPGSFLACRKTYCKAELTGCPLRWIKLLCRLPHATSDVPKHAPPTQGRSPPVVLRSLKYTFLSLGEESSVHISRTESICAEAEGHNRSEGHEVPGSPLHSLPSHSQWDPHRRSGYSSAGELRPRSGNDCPTFMLTLRSKREK